MTRKESRAWQKTNEHAKQERSPLQYCRKTADRCYFPSNSFSMKHRNAVNPLLKALDKFFGQLRSMDRLHLIVFDDDETVAVNGKDLHLEVESSYDPQALNSFLQNRFSEHLTSRTYLYDAMYAGLDIVAKMPLDSNRFMVVFSDGEEINSVVKEGELESTAQNLQFRAYAVDYMPGPQRDPFLTEFTKKNNGRLWKADSAEELHPIFKDLSTAMFKQYVVKYRFASPPKGAISIEPTTAITIEEVVATDSSRTWKHRR